MRNTSGLWRGQSPGRPAGQPDGATRRLKAFCQGIVEEAMNDPALRARLVEQLKTLTIDRKLLQMLLDRGYGKPAMSLEVTRREPSMAQLIAGTYKDDAEDDEGARPSEADTRH